MENCFRPLKYGPLEISPPIIEAALSGYSDAPMRRIAKRFGCPMALCEVFLDQFVLNVSKRSKARLYLAVAETDHPCGAQLMGGDADEFVAAALKLLEFGFDAIDLNFACPVKKVLGRARGGSLMADPNRALKIAAKVRVALPDSVPLSVKLRKGFDDSPASEEHFFRLLEGLLDLGAAGITLHGRTVRQGYAGRADWDFVRRVKNWLSEVKNRPDFFLIGSGDLFDAETCVRRLTESRVDALALARGVIGNPWLFSEINALLSGRSVPRPPTLAEQKAVITEHWRMVEELYGPKRASAVMRKFLIRYADRHSQPETVRQEFVRFKGTEQLNEIFARYYGPQETIERTTDQ